MKKPYYKNVILHMKKPYYRTNVINKHGNIFINNYNFVKRILIKTDV